MSEFIELYDGEVKIKFNDGNHSYWTEGEELKKDGTPKLKRLCGVTTYCGIINKPFLIPWAVNTTVDFIKERIDLLKTTTGNQILSMARQEADNQKNISADIGKAIHLWVEQHIKGEEPSMPEDPKVLEGVNNFLSWAEKNKVKFLWTEKVVYSKKHGFVGTADIGIEINGKKYLLDIKTGNDIYPEVKMQTSAYLMAETEESGTEYAGRFVLRISKESEAEYMQRMEKKSARYKNGFEIPPFQIFEAIYLDDEESALEKDFMGFLACMKVKQWQDYATKDLMELKKKSKENVNIMDIPF